MDLLPVLIVANPYEAELCRRALGDTGLPVGISDGGEDLDGLLERGALLIVVATGLYMSEPDEVVARARKSMPDVPVFLIADDEHELGGLSVTRRFMRPFDAEELAHAIEQVAVAAEKAAGDLDDEPDVIMEEAVVPDAVARLLPPEVIPRVPTEPLLDAVKDPPPIADVDENAARRAALHSAPTPTPGVTPVFSSALPTSLPIVEMNAAPEPSVPVRSTLSLLRADEALLDALGPLELQSSSDRLSDAAINDAFADPEATRLVVRNSESVARARRVTTEMKAVTHPGIERGDAYGAALDDIDLDSLDVPSPTPAARTVPGASTAVNEPITSKGTAPSPEVWDDASSQAAATAAVPDEQGDLSYIDVAALMARLIQSRYSGRLYFHRSDGDKSIYFEDGAPVAAASTLATDRLAEILYRDGKITRDQHARLRSQGPGHGRAGAAELQAAGLVKQREMFALLRRHTEEVFYSLFSWESGSYQLRNDASPVDDRVRPGQSPWTLVLEGIRRKYSLERLIELVGPAETVLRPTTLMSVLDDLTLSDAERVAVGLFDGERTLGDILAAMRGVRSTALGEAGLYALAWWLLGAGALSTAEEGELALPSSAVPTQVTPISLGRARERRHRDRPSDGDGDDERAIERERILAKLDQLAEADYFALLGVERHATTHEIRRAYERLKSDFLPDRFSAPVQAELSEALSEITLVLSEAFRVLSDEALRSSYRSHLID